MVPRKISQFLVQIFGGNSDEKYQKFVNAFLSWRKRTFTDWIDIARQYKVFCL